MDFTNLIEKCNGCGLGKSSTGQCVPEGSADPQIYFIGDSPLIDEKGDKPFVGEAGRKLHSILDSFGLNINNCRFFNICRCKPIDTSESGEISFRKASKEEIKACCGFYKADIERTKPKVIIALGSTVMRELLPEVSGTITQVRGKTFNYNGIVTIPTFHPSFLLKNISAEYNFKTDIKLAIDIVMGRSTGYTDNKSGTFLCKSYSEFNEFCNKYIDPYNEIAYDVETNAEEIHSESHRIVGFSLASSKDVGCYVPLDSIDFKFDPNDKILVEKRVKDILLNKKIIVYNCQHEYPVTLNWLDIEIPDLEDIFVMVKLMMGNADKYQGNGGLKMQCVQYLHYNDWSADVDEYFKYFSNYASNELAMRNLIGKYYEDQEVNSVLKLVEDCSLSNPNTYSYRVIPYKIVGRYGSIDSSVLFELKKYYENEISKLSETLGVDIMKGYKCWLAQHYAGYTLELNGAYWNDEKAKKVEEWCSNGMNSSLKYLINSPLSREQIKESVYPNYLQYLKDNYIDIVFKDRYIPKRMTKNSIYVTCLTEEASRRLESMSRYSEEKKDKTGAIIKTGVYKLELGNFETLARDILGSELDSKFEEFYTSYIEEFNRTSHSIEEMKKLINPTSTSPYWREFMAKILIDKNIRIAKFYSDLCILTDDPNFNIEYYKTFYDIDKEEPCDSDKYQRDFDLSQYILSHPHVTYIDNSDTKLLSIIIKLKNSDLNKPDRFKLFKKYLDNNGISHRHRKIDRAFSDSQGYKFDTLDKSVMINLFGYYEYLGIDIENPDTWTEEFKWLYNYQAYKKYAKKISTYIKGKVGRSSVYYVDKESFERGDKISRRHKQYFEAEQREDECCVCQTPFKVNMADSGRWKATLHTLPSNPTGGDIKGIFTSRFKGGVIAMPDCSQAEVRVLAAQSEDENLIKAFQTEGMDIHKFVASLIYHDGDIEKVTPQERKLAKGAVFGILYGESVKSFADENFHGDVQEAQKVFDFFFNSFPKIKNYVEWSHSQYDKWKKVTLPITGRFIDYSPMELENGTDKDRIYRQCQNGIIQGTTCDVAGMILYNICEFLKKNSLKSKPICFIHDSIEIDLHPDETFRMLDQLRGLFNDYPWETYKVPMASDIVFSTNMGTEIDCVELIHDEDYNDVTITMKGFKEDIDEVIETWKTVYDVVEEDLTFEKPEPKEVKVPMRCMFQEKVEITFRTGTTIHEVKERYHIIRKKA